MPVGLTLAKLIGPVAAATIVNLFLFALAWRGHQAEMRTGRPPWWLGAGAAVYGLAVAAFLHWRNGPSLSRGIDVFAAVVAGEMLGAVIVYGLLWGFLFTRGRPWTERAFPIGASLMLAVGMAATVLTG